MFRFFGFWAILAGIILCIFGFMAVADSTINGITYLLFGIESFFLAFACYKFDDMDNRIIKNTRTINDDKSTNTKTAQQVKELQSSVAILKKNLAACEEKLATLNNSDSKNDE